MEKQKILYLCPNGYLGGAERFVVNLTLHQHRGLFFEPVVLFFSDGEAARILREASVLTLTLPFKLRLSNPYSLVKTIVFIRRLIRSEKCKLVHFTMPYSVLTGYLATLFLDIRTVWFQHGPVGGLLDHLANLFPLDAIFFNSHYLQNEHNKMFNLYQNPEGQHVIPLGVPDTLISFAQIKRIRADLKCSSSKLLFLTAGRFTSFKGIHVLVDAVARLKNENPALLQHCHFLVVGSPMTEKDRIYEQDVKQKVRELRLENEMSFYSFKEDLHNYMAAADVFLHCAIKPESFGLVLLEAMLQECLVIASDAGGAKEILQEGKNALVVDYSASDNAKKLCSLLAELLQEYSLLQNNNDFYINIRRFSRQYVLDNFSLEQMVARIDRLYLAMLEKD